MTRRWRLTVLSAFVLGCSFATANAQYFYPGGYGTYGWGGWGATNPYGDLARGMGVYAAGAGVYNRQTAEANAINARTTAAFNEYLWESQQITNQRYARRVEARSKRINENRQATQDRKRNNPNSVDIYSGDALNIALDELTSPKVYLRALKGVNQKISGESARKIPFQYAAGAVALSIHDLVDSGPPEVLKQEIFADDLAALKKIAKELREEAEATPGQLNPAKIKELQDALMAFKTDFLATYKRGTREFNDAAAYLKGVYGLTTMLNTPALNVILKDVEKRPEVELGQILAFMSAFNLRFGVANSAAEKSVYDQLFPMLDRLRDEAVPDGKVTELEKRSSSASRPGEFFSGMEFEHFDAKKTTSEPPKPASPK